ncbi:amidohydrolase family protein [Mycobacterium avium]|uniref:amidohydrolase family protein n=1 Tax=Mycobacterium avium TaxID=1764 RepID=UPI001CC78FFF|nr:amidohydrolase family protein [Mycobacterium avium]MBZ4521793.1 amidohydrolase [Mycobacterium avium subsp. hominissuis]MBZ4531195.1 amidohydrolase [Mycobacterium avium subsp. hominissuis]
MLIDLHAHQITKEMFNQDEHWGPFWHDGTLRIGDWVLGSKVYPGQPAKPGTVDELYDGHWAPEPRLAAFDKAGIDKVVVSMPLHMVMYHTGAAFANRWAHTVNDSLAQWCSTNPERFYFWAQVPMQDPQAAAKELERAVTELGAQGISIGGANFGGREAHDPALYPVWEKISELGVMVFVHGYNQSVTWGAKACDDPFDTTSIVGMNSDETLFYWNLTNGGVLDDFPDLKILITHGGGFVPFQLGRFNATNKTMAPDSKNKKELIEYNSHFFYDLDIHSPIMRRAIIDEVGVDQMLYGDNFSGSDIHEGDLTEGLGLSPADQDKIRSENAKPLLKL